MRIIELHEFSAIIVVDQDISAWRIKSFIAPSLIGIREKRLSQYIEFLSYLRNSIAVLNAMLGNIGETEKKE